MINLNQYEPLHSTFDPTSIQDHQVPPSPPPDLTGALAMQVGRTPQNNWLPDAIRAGLMMGAVGGGVLGTNYLMNRSKKKLSDEDLEDYARNHYFQDKSRKDQFKKHSFECRCKK